MSATSATGALGIAGLLAATLLASAALVEFSVKASPTSSEETRASLPLSAPGEEPYLLDHAIAPEQGPEIEEVSETESAEPAPWPPSAETVLTLVQVTWPEDRAVATWIVQCESKAGQHPDTYSLDAVNAGPMQINYYTWARYFEQVYGWSWEQVVTDIDIHFMAARHIYDRAGGWAPWGCYW
jgi:hypothetical protein